MPTQGVQFGGQTLQEPGAYYNDNVSAVNKPNNTLVPPLLVIGNSFGGQPQTLLYFSSLQQGQALMRGGPVSDFLPFLFNPSDQLNGASSVTFINCSANTPATLSIPNSNSVNAITLTTGDYGLPSNLMQLQLTANVIVGMDATLIDNFSGSVVVGTGLEYPLVLQYTGAATTGITSVVTGTQNNTTTMTLSSGVSGETLVVNLGPAAHATISAVAETINGSSFPWRAYVNSLPNMPSQLIDAGTTDFVSESGSSSIAVYGAGYYAPLPTLYNGLNYWANNLTNGMVTSTIIASGSPVAFDDTNWLNFSGGSNVPPENSDYANALNLALTTPAWIVFCDSNDAAVQALLAQHVQTASSIPNRNPRRGMTGASGPDGISMAEAMSAAIDLNTREVTYCYPGLYRTNTVTGVNTLYGGLYLAAVAAGIACGNDPSLPLTNKNIGCNGLEVNLLSSQVGQLQNAGVLTAYSPNRNSVPVFALDVTTWQNDNNPENTLNQQVANRQFLEYGFIAALQPYIGSIINAYTLAIQKNAAKDFLNAQVRGANSTGCLAIWDATSLILTYDGENQTVYVQASVIFVGQNAWTLISTYVQPLNLTTANT